jgi:DNA polymerase
VLVGEAPGKKENESGRPFVGSAGKILDGVLKDAGLSREDVYITNILKCRPPDNRRPKKREVELCEVYLMKQLEIIKPIVVSPMGNVSLAFFFNKFGLKKAKIGEVHGKVFDLEAPWGSIKLVPLYHPAAAIYNRQLLQKLQKDIKLAIQSSR